MQVESCKKFKKTRLLLIAAILIIKSDVIKQRIELQKIIEVQKEVKKELLNI